MNTAQHSAAQKGSGDLRCEERGAQQGSRYLWYEESDAPQNWPKG